MSFFQPATSAFVTTRRRRRLVIAMDSLRWRATLRYPAFQSFSTLCFTATAPVRFCTRIGRAEGQR